MIDDPICTGALDFHGETRPGGSSSERRHLPIDKKAPSKFSTHAYSELKREASNVADDSDVTTRRRIATRVSPTVHRFLARLILINFSARSASPLARRTTAR